MPLTAISPHPHDGSMPQPRTEVPAPENVPLRYPCARAPSLERTTRRLPSWRSPSEQLRAADSIYPNILHELFHRGTPCSALATAALPLAVDSACSCQSCMPGTKVQGAPVSAASCAGQPVRPASHRTASCVVVFAGDCVFLQRLCRAALFGKRGAFGADATSIRGVPEEHPAH